MPAILPPAAMFLCNAVLHITLFTRLPAIADAAGISKGVLGLCLLGTALGTFVSLPIAGAVCDRIGPRRVIFPLLCVIACILPFISLVPFFGFVFTFIAYGFLRTLIDLSQNMLTIGIEKRTGKKILSRSHGFWSVGLLVGSLGTSVFVALGASPFVHQAIVSAIVIIVLGFVFFTMPHDVIEPPAPVGHRPVFVRPNMSILLICAMTIGIAVSEGTIYDWGAFYLRERVLAEPSLVGALFACFTIGMGGMRMSGDVLRNRFKDSTIVRWSAIGAAIGVIILLVLPYAITAGIGLALVGAGVALNAPIAASVTANLSTGTPSNNLAALSLVMLLCTLGVPPLFGFIAEHFGLWLSFVCLLPLLALSAYMAPVAQRR